MADDRWRNDERRDWDRERARFGADRNQNGRPDWRDEEHAAGDRFGENWNRWDRNAGRDNPDQGRGGDYGERAMNPGRASDLNQRPGGMRDQRDWRDGTRFNAGNRNDFADFSGNSGSRPADYQDYGDWQGEGSFSDFGGPRFGSNYGRSRDAYRHGPGDYAGDGRPYGTYGRDYGDDRQTNRNFWNKASDEVASWAGDRDAERRRQQDHVQDHSGRGPKGYTRSDDRIREDVSDRLTDDWRLDASNIEVSVSNAEVTLDGTVATRGDKRHAEDLADGVSCVRHVQNNLRVKDSWTATGAEQSLSTPVGSTGANTSIAENSSRQGIGQPQVNTNGSSGLGSSSNTSSSH